MNTPGFSLPCIKTPSRQHRRLGDQHASLCAVVQNQLRARILNGDYQPGDRLVEGKLATELGVSRIPIREALRELAAEGLVTIEPRRGASITVPSPAVTYDMVEVRATLEGLNTKLATQRRNAADVKKLQAMLARGKQAVDDSDLKQLASLNQQFHEVLATLSGNVVLTELVRLLRDRTALLFGASSQQRIYQNWEEHSQILNAVIAGNAELANLLAIQHVNSVAQTYRETQETE